MKKTILYIIFSLLSINYLTAQISQKGTPYSWNHPEAIQYNELMALPGAKAIPEAVKTKSNQSLKSSSFTFAYAFDVNKGIWDAGIWTDLPNGDRIWQLTISSEGAYSLSVNFSRFLLPEGARVFIFNQEHSQVLGAFTSANNKTWQRLAVQPISGSTITIEYYEPEEVDFEAELTIGTVGHDFLGVFAEKDGNFGRADTCNIDINCADGADWQTEKRAVCRLLINGTELCSGALLNNSLQDQTPYVLSANHCLDNQYLAENTVFVFNYESPSCDGPDGSIAQSISGADLVATKNRDAGYLDFVLLKLSVSVPLSYQPYFAGWDSRDLTPNSGTCISHPYGDVKKIAHDYDQPVTASYLSQYFYDPDAFWKVLEWDKGTTEPGSSGSPLFNESKRIVGSLTGDDGDPYDCEKPINDYFQMVSVAFDKYSADSLQLKHWLVPDNSSISFLDGFDPLANTSTVTDKINVIHWEEGQQLAFYVANAGGYLAGNNIYQDKQKAEFFNKIEFSPLNAVSGAYVAFAYATGNDDTEIEMRVYRESFGQPSTILGSAYASLKEIKDKADKEYVYFNFDPAVEVNSSIFLSVVLPQNAGDTVALMTVEEAKENTAWEQNYENLWYPYSNPDYSWNISLSHIIAMEIGRFAGVEDKQEVSKSWRIYPNPTSDKFKIDQANEIDKVEIYDVMGRKLDMISNVYASDAIEISVAGLKTGIYMVLIFTGDQVVSNKISVESN